MARQCFLEKESDPPLCGIHHVRLEKKPLPEELIASGFKAFTFLVCPVSGEIIDDPPTQGQDRAPRA
jgi:hypothetical protein